MQEGPFLKRRYNPAIWDLVDFKQPIFGFSLLYISVITKIDFWFNEKNKFRNKGDI